MAFQFSNANTPYYQAPAPELPGRVNIPRGDMVGNSIVNAFVQKAMADERAQLEQQRLMQNADIAAKGMQLDYDKLNQQHELQSRALDIQAEHMQHSNAHLDQLSETAKTNSKLYGTAFQRSLIFEQKRSQLMQKAGETADKLKLTDPEFQTSNPMQFARNAYEFEKKFGSTVDPQLKAAVAGYIGKAEESKVKLGETTYPWSQIVKDLAINEDKSQFYQMLLDNDYIKERKVFEKSGPDAPEPIHQDISEPTGEAKRMLASAKGVDFKSLKNVRPEVSQYDPKNPTANIAAGGAIDMGVQRPPSGFAGAPAPQMSAAERAAAYVKQKNAEDPAGAAARNALYLKNYPGRGDLL